MNRPGVADVQDFSDRMRRLLEEAAAAPLMPGLMESVQGVSTPWTRLRARLCIALPTVMFLVAGMCFTVKMYPDPLGTAGCMLFIAATVINLMRELQ